MQVVGDELTDLCWGRVVPETLELLFDVINLRQLGLRSSLELLARMVEDGLNPWIRNPAATCLRGSFECLRVNGVVVGLELSDARPGDAFHLPGVADRCPGFRLVLEDSGESRALLDDQLLLV